MAIYKKCQIISCSTAAGHAFEGCGFSNGSSAIGCAITEINVQDNILKISHLGNKISSICGSGIISILSLFCDYEIIDETGLNRIDMKVLFTFGGTPHYLCSLLDKLQHKGLELVVVTPQRGNSIIGAGVKMVDGGSFRRIATHEKVMLWGKVAYPELTNIITQEQDRKSVV